MSTTIERFGPWATRVLEIQDPVERQVFLDTVNRRTQHGCVVRSLESAFEVEATDQEWDMRIADIDVIEAEFKPLLRATNCNEEKKFINAVAKLTDRRIIAEYVGIVARHDTPLGDALRRHRMFDIDLGSQEIDRRVRAGEILLVDVERQRGRHLVHAGIKEDQLVALSDDGEPLVLTDAISYSVFSFNKI
jgi:hypothetical protein